MSWVTPQTGSPHKVRLCWKRTSSTVPDRPAPTELVAGTAPETGPTGPHARTDSVSTLYEQAIGSALFAADGLPLLAWTALNAGNKSNTPCRRLLLVELCPVDGRNVACHRNGRWS